MATGVVFYHRFYMFHSFNEFPRYMTATCCLFLAGKVEETPKKCKDLVKAAKSWLESKNFKSYADQFTDASIKEIMIHERILLQTIKFDLQVDHPYGYLLKYAKTLKGNQEQIRSMVQMAWTFINDSFCTTLCLQWEPEIIAIALMYLTSKLSKVCEGVVNNMFAPFFASTCAFGPTQRAVQKTTQPYRPCCLLDVPTASCFGARVQSCVAFIRYCRCL